MGLLGVRIKGLAHRVWPSARHLPALWEAASLATWLGQMVGDSRRQVCCVFCRRQAIFGEAVTDISFVALAA